MGGARHKLGWPTQLRLGPWAEDLGRVERRLGYPRKQHQTCKCHHRVELSQEGTWQAVPRPGNITDHILELYYLRASAGMR